MNLFYFNPLNIIQTVEILWKTHIIRQRDLDDAEITGAVEAGDDLKTAIIKLQKQMDAVNP